MLYDPNWKPKTEVVDEVGQLMLKAADYLETHKWCQGHLVRRNGAVCMIGSLIKVEFGRVTDNTNLYNCPLTGKAGMRLMNYLNEVKNYDKSPMDWNDSWSRKKKEVIEILRVAAKYQSIKN